jgi:hypothetical protein
MDKYEIIKEIAQISSGFHNAQTKIISEQPGINTSKDARVTVFTNCYIVLDSIYVCLIVRAYEIPEPKQIADICNYSSFIEFTIKCYYVVTCPTSVFSFFNKDNTLS